MPPPPPPSKSYLLVLDSDSSDDSEDEYPYRQEYNTRRENLKAVAPSRVFDVWENDNAEVYENPSESGAKQGFDSVPKEPAPLVLQSSSPTHEEGHQSSKPVNDQTHQNNKNTKLTKNQKKRRQRKNKKSTTQKQGNEEHKSHEENSKRVYFSDVAIRAFPRAFSADTVPVHGGWPLGMELEGYEDIDKVPIEEYETSKQNRLCERWRAILSSRDNKTQGSPSKSSSPSKKKKEKEKVVDEEIIRLIDVDATVNECGVNDDHDATPTNKIYESRQWDYRRLKNPLFGSVSEDQRHAIFLETNGTDLSMVTESQNHNNNKNTGRARSNSMGNHSHIGSSARSRSNSLGNHDLGNSMKGKFNEEYAQAMVHHVRNELEQIRFERNKSGATGCNCRKLVVYLPPKDGSGGKKAQHRRLKPSKVVQELKKRHLYDPSVASMSREQMEKILHKAVENEPCCRDDNCFCVRNGIICQADACSCWHDSHVHVKHNSGSNSHVLSNDDIRKRCGNPEGTYLVDSKAIDRYRIEIIKQTKLQQREYIESDGLICQLVEPS
jgi:hypothetical protein